METEEILHELDTIFRDILKNENITLTPETTAKDVESPTRHRATGTES